MKRTLAGMALAVTVAGGCTGPGRSAPPRHVSAWDMRWQRDIAYLASHLPAARAAGLGTVYLKYNQCLSDDGFQQLATRALTLLKAHHDYRLIVDLRNNRGGNTAPFRSLITGLQDNPQISPARIIGLVNQYTASSATLDAEDLKQAGAALIGQTTAMSLDT